MYSTGNKTVDAITRINITGNVTPNSWYKEITFENGKADLVAITLLSDFVYWYKAREDRDERTGNTIRMTKRFRGDLLQRSYDDMAERFGITKRQAQDACKRLHDMNLIKRELRNLVVNGQRVNNVLFIDLNPESIERITHGAPYKAEPAPNGTPITLERDTPHVETGEGSHQDGTPPTLERDTNTEITTKTTQEITQDNNLKSSVKPSLTEQCIDIMNYLAAKSGINNKPDAKGHHKYILARFKEGYKFEDFIKVIDNKVAEWGNKPSMRQFLRAKTLFSNEHFDNYLNQEIPQKTIAAETQTDYDFDNLPTPEFAIDNPFDRFKEFIDGGDET